MSDCTINITTEKTVEEFHSGLRFKYMPKGTGDGRRSNGTREHESVKVFLVDEDGYSIAGGNIGDFILRDGKWEFYRRRGVMGEYIHTETIPDDRFAGITIRNRVIRTK